MAGVSGRRSPGQVRGSSARRGAVSKPGAYRVRRAGPGTSLLVAAGGGGAPTFPPDFDSFTRTDGVGMGSTEGRGTAWTVDDGGGTDVQQVGIQDDQARNWAFTPTHPSGHTSTGYAWIDGLTPDGTVAYKLAAHAMSQGQGSLLFRYIDPGNHWHLSVPAVGFCQIARVVAGVGTVLGTASGQPFTAGDEFAIKGVADQITGYCNGTQILGPFTSTFNETATGVGFSISWPNWVDDWSWSPA